MITEDYCSFETAKLLKEKGFDDLCRSYWSDNNSLSFEHTKWFVANDNDFVYLLRPTLQMAMKWLRDVHNLWCEISWEGKGLWCMEVFSLMDEEFMPGSIVHEIKSYEEACEAAIKYCLENLI